MRGAPDPYRELGVPRGATDEQVKAAHRRLAKRYHPDSADGDQTRFLAVQEAYLLLSDPIRRRDWDSRHAPGPVRANERPVAPRPHTPSATPPVRPPTTSGRSGTSGGSRPATDPDPAAAFGSASGRDPGVRRTTWSAEGVPWWEDFRAEGVTRGGGPPTGAARPPSGTGSRGDGPPGGPAPGAVPPPSQGPGAGDIYSRSSGAAWSSAARRHFRRDDADLPRGGQFRYRGTQVVTGAESRHEAAAEVRRAAAAAEVRRDAAAAARRPSAQASTAPKPAPPAPSATRSTPTPTPTPTPDPTVGLRSRLRKLLGGS
jgi:curved DNA-binding protein CbpA